VRTTASTSWKMSNLQWPSLQVSLIIGLILRLIAAVYSKGYAMHDDHFEVLDEGPFNAWLAWDGVHGAPYGHSLIYPGLIHGLLWVLSSMGVTDPQQQMFVVRLLHAVYSMVIIAAAYGIAKQYGGEKSARAAAFIVAVFWLFPFMSVRNLIEFVCIPPLMVGWYLQKRGSTPSSHTTHSTHAWIALSGLCFALAFSFRYHTALIPATLFFVYLFRREHKRAFTLLGWCLLAVVLTQGLADLLTWGIPFQPLYEYVMGTFVSGTEFVNGPPYQFVALLVGILIPPTSLLFLYWLWKYSNRNEVLELLLPIAVFVVAHSLVSNKQERFILPIVPIILVCVAIFWVRSAELVKSGWPKKLRTVAIVWFWVGNSALLVLWTITYSKRTRVESLTVLSTKADVTGVVVLADPFVFVPKFYLKQQVPMFRVNPRDSTDWNAVRKANPNYVVCMDEQFQSSLLLRTQYELQKFAVATDTITGSIMDDVLHVTNPRGNKNQRAIIYRLK